MDERAFIERRRPEWERLSDLLKRATSFSGLKSLSGSELADIGKLYRRVTSDLSHIKANSANDDLILYLNELAGRAHGVLYVDAPTGGLRSINHFLLKGFPILFRAKRRFIAFAAAIMLLASVFAAVIVTNDSRTSVYFMPEQFQQADEHTEMHDNDMPAAFSGYLMVNNIYVSLMAFAGGISFGMFTIYALIRNGLMLGAFIVKPYAFLNDPLDIAAFLLPHGFIELTAIIIAGGAGLMMGWALIAPGNLTRWDSLKKASKDALPLMGGVVAMLIVAGIIESFIARTDVPRSLQLLVAAISAIALILYFGFAGWKDDQSANRRTASEKA